jgi:hypothetical protein
MVFLANNKFIKYQSIFRIKLCLLQSYSSRSIHIRSTFPLHAASSSLVIFDPHQFSDEWVINRQILFAMLLSSGVPTQNLSTSTNSPLLQYGMKLSMYPFTATLIAIEQEKTEIFTNLLLMNLCEGYRFFLFLRVF